MYRSDLPARVKRAAKESGFNCEWDLEDGTDFVALAESLESRFPGIEITRTRSDRAWKLMTSNYRSGRNENYR